MSQEQVEQNTGSNRGFIGVLQDFLKGLLNILLWLGVFTVQIIIMAFIVGSLMLAIVGTEELLSAAAELVGFFASRRWVLTGSSISQTFNEKTLLFIQHYTFSLLLFFFAVILYGVVMENIKFVGLRFKALGDLEDKLKEYLFAILASTLAVVVLGRIIADANALSSSIGAGVLIVAMSVYLILSTRKSD